MTENENAGCRFPIAADRLCGRPVVPTNSDEKGRGAPSGYCDDPAHNRAAAWRARRAFAEAAGKEAADADEQLSTPVTSAGIQAGQLLDRTRALADELIAAQQQLAERLATIGDLDATALELETATTALNLKVDDAEARYQQAVKALREQRELRQDADAAAVDAEQRLAATTGELAAAESRITEVEHFAEAANEQAVELNAQLEQAHAEIAERQAAESQLRGELAAEEERADDLAVSLQSATDAFREAQQELDELRGRHEQLDGQHRAAVAERDAALTAQRAAEADAAALRSSLARADEQIAELRDALTARETARDSALADVAKLRAENAGLVAQLDAAKNAQAAAENHGNQRVADLERLYHDELAALRREVEQLRQPKK